MCDKTCESCPFAFTDKSEEAQGYGCLPTPYDITRMRVDHGKTWACHMDYEKPCVGAIQHLKEQGLPYKVIDPELVNAESETWPGAVPDWWQCVQ